MAGVVLAMIGASTAKAQERAFPSVEIAAGWIGFADDTLISELLVGGAARWPLSERVSVGPEVVYISGDGHSHVVLTGNLTVDLRSPGATGPRVVPFVVVGGGLFRTSESFGVTSFSSGEGAFTAGGGVRASASDRVQVGVDVRAGWETHVRVNGFVAFRLGARP